MTDVSTELSWKQIDDLMGWWPMRLGDHAESVIEMLRQAVFVGSRHGELRKKTNTEEHKSGEPAIKVDEMANTHVRELCDLYGEEVKERFGLDVLTVGEEEAGGVYGSKVQIDQFNSSHLIVVADPLDGSTNCKTFGCGYSTVLVSFVPRARGGYQLIGGAIADSNGHTVVWDGLKSVWARYNGMPKGEYKPLNLQQEPSSAVAAVATKSDRLKDALRQMETIQPGISESALLMTMAGTPSAFALCALGLGMVIETKAQKCWDAAHLYPALLLGLEARTIPSEAGTDSVPISADQVTSYFGMFLDKFRHTPELVVPPFYIKN